MTTSDHFRHLLTLSLALIAPNLNLSAQEMPLADLLRKASVQGKYSLLLHQIHAPEDKKTSGLFEEPGYRRMASFKGQRDLSPGFWVYAHPYWYVWGDHRDVPPVNRQWGPEQVIGPPNTWPRFGDLITAWASADPDGRDEWLLLEYDKPRLLHSVLVYATYNPGAISRVTLFQLNGKEVEVWKGKDPTPVGSPKGISIIPFRVGFKSSRVKIYLNSTKVTGWNEIDAVGAIDRSGRMHWAKSVAASTVYGQPNVISAQERRIEPIRIQMLEDQVRRLKERVRDLRHRVLERKKKKQAGPVGMIPPSSIVTALVTLPLLSEAEKPLAENEEKLDAALKKASVKGKYHMLLRQIKVADDRGRYRDFNDYGSRSVSSYKGFKNLPNGFWVYVYPYWYIWKHRGPQPARPYGAEQATGRPNTNQAGDYPTAWASQTQDGQDEWLLMEYEKVVSIKEVHVHETFNPGAIVRVTAFSLTGEEVEIWRGKDPLAGQSKGVAKLKAKKPVRSARIKLYIDSKNTRGWNEIDAVGVLPDKGNVIWARSAAASTVYGQTIPTVSNNDRIRQLEEEVRELRRIVRELEKALEKDK